MNQADYFTFFGLVFFIVEGDRSIAHFYPVDGKDPDSASFDLQGDEPEFCRG